jgi:NADH:ubiquinone oxidoreductase subunit 3 (subunit A)
VTAAQAVSFVLGAVVAATAFIGAVFLANRFLAPKNPSATKESPFECGMEQAGAPWNSPRLRFAAIAMLFVLFDAEAVLLFAVATKLRGSFVALAEVGAFVLFLGFGLAYAWRKGALEWRM